VVARVHRRGAMARLIDKRPIIDRRPADGGPFHFR
jgi:hypothetical protein